MLFCKVAIGKLEKNLGYFPGHWSKPSWSLPHWVNACYPVAPQESVKSLVPFIVMH